MQNLKNWRMGKGWTQGDLAEKLGSNQKSYSAYETGRTVMPGEIQAKLRKLGYVGAFPHEAGAEPDFISREEFAEYRGSVKAEISMLRDSLEKAFEQLRDLALRLPEESRPKAR